LNGKVLEQKFLLWVTDIDVVWIFDLSSVAGANVQPNGRYPARDGMVLIVGFRGADQPRGIFALGVSGQIKQLSDPIGRLDGVYELRDGSLLITDWNTGRALALERKERRAAARFRLQRSRGLLRVPESGGGLTVVVPDLAQSQLRFIHLRK
jgi:hypothetical protein